MKLQNSCSCSQVPAALRSARSWAFVTLVAAALAAAPTPTKAATEPVDPHKAVFVDDPASGKDPFFPRSIRRKRTVVEETPVPIVVPDDSLVLKGLSGTAEKRLAIINNYTFQAGEEYVLRVGTGQLKVRCLEIRDQSVLVNVNGITRELRMRSKL